MNRNLLFFNLLTAIFIACILFPTQSKADVIATKDTVTGTVIDKKKNPIPGAKVEIVGQPYSAFTDLDGRFNIKCEQGAKKVLVSYPKVKNVKMKISPDMTVQIGRSWKQVPERYQWFVGAGVGIGYIYGGEDHFSTDISVMVGRVKAIGWYVRTHYIKESTRMVSDGYYKYAEQGSSMGGTFGGMVRLGCPLHLLVGIGYESTSLSNERGGGYLLEGGFLFRIKDNFGINLIANSGDSKITENYTSFSLGFNYFFNK